MATVVGSGQYNDNAYFEHSWTALLNGDDGRPISMGGLADKSLQVTGTFGTSGEVVIEGSMDKTNWVMLTDPQGTALSFTAGGLSTILQNPKYVRPNVTAGDGTTSLTVAIGASSLK